MEESLKVFDAFIHDEMMVHPVLFTHPKAKTLALINSPNQSILEEILKHKHLTDIWLINPAAPNTNEDTRIHVYQGDTEEWLHAKPGPFDVIIIPDVSKMPAFTKASYEAYQHILDTNGIFICQSDSLFKLQPLKQTYHRMHEAGFDDLQIMHFPQPGFPSGARAAIMAIKKGSFNRIREKDIYNKTFQTQYYNFDTHKAALVMPEFLRKELSLDH